MAYWMGEVLGFNLDGVLIDIIGISENIQDIQVFVFEFEQFMMMIDWGLLEYIYLDMGIVVFFGCEYDCVLQLGYVFGMQVVLLLDGFVIVDGEGMVLDSCFYKEVDLDFYFVELCSEINILQF